MWVHADAHGISIFGALAWLNFVAAAETHW
jgi:hypothetical protein